MWRKNKMENKNLNTAVKDEKIVKTESVKVNEATGEVVEENNKIYQPIKCTISHRKGSSVSDSFYSFVFKIVTNDDFELPVTFSLLEDEVSNVNLCADNFLKKIPVNSSRNVNIKGCFYLGRNENDSVYVMAVISLPGNVIKAIKFGRNQNNFISKCFAMNKSLYLISSEIKDGNRVDVKNAIEFSKSKAKSIDDLYADYED